MSTPLLSAVERLLPRNVPPTHPGMVDTIAADDLVIRLGTLTSGPQTVKPGAAVASLRELSAEEQSLAAERAQEDAELAEKRAQAIELQDRLASMQAERKRLTHEISWCNGALHQYGARVAEIEAHVDATFGSDVKLHDHWQERAERKAMLELIPAGLERRKKRLAALEKELAAFAKQHAVEI